MLTADCKSSLVVRFCSCPETSNSGHGYSLVLCPEVGWTQEHNAFCPPHQPNKFRWERADRSLTKKQGLFPLEGMGHLAVMGHRCPKAEKNCGVVRLPRGRTSSENSTWQEISKTVMWCKSSQERWYKAPIVPTNAIYSPEHPVHSYMAQFSKANFQ